MAAGKPRSWGFWTERKLAILERYLPAFTRASSGQPERIYIDAFAGEGVGISKLTGEQFDASARLALQTIPPFTRLIFCERPRRARRLRELLQRDFPHRVEDFKVLGDDCNVAIPNALGRLRSSGLHWAPTFAFLDPYGMQIDFMTLRALAEHKRGYRHPRSPKPEYKVELWLLFPSTAIGRTAAWDDQRGIPLQQRRATKVFGTPAWETIHKLRAVEKLSAEEAREEYVNLMRWQLERVLGYQWTHPLQISDLRKRPVYHMILATDNKAGTDIMSDIYRKAVRENPALYEHARQQQTGQFALPFEALTTPIGEGYRYRETLPLLMPNGERSSS